MLIVRVGLLAPDVAASGPRLVGLQQHIDRLAMVAASSGKSSLNGCGRKITRAPRASSAATIRSPTGNE